MKSERFFCHPTEEQGGGFIRRKTSNSKTGSGTRRGDSIYAVLMTFQSD
jgi:hypothetical protein